MAQAAGNYADWAVNPAEPGANLPPSGRSLFDQLVGNEHGGYDLPFPLTSLLDRLARRAGCVHALRGVYQDCYRSVLVPLGRSLQRSAVRDVAGASSADFFKYPRAVFAIVDDYAGVSGVPLARDRLYLGYHERAEVVEVISYNEAAARFEFQIVKDYGANGSPRVLYANRAVCIACHQNHAPIFSRQVWDETNANPAIAKALLATGRQSYGVRIERGVDIPRAIDNGISRANLLAAQQVMWQHGCGGNDLSARRCRASAFIAALQYALSGELGYDAASEEWEETFAKPFSARFSQRWPHGLTLPEAGLPNRDPLQTEYSAQLGHVAAKFDALQPRAPSNVWQRIDASRQLISGIAATITRVDIAALNRALSPQRVNSSVRAYTQRCSIARQAHRTAFTCEGGRWRGSVQRDAGGTLSGVVDHVALPEGAPFPALKLTALRGAARNLSGALERDGIPARTVDGHLLARFALRDIGPKTASATLEVVEDFAALRAAVARIAADRSEDAFADLPYRSAEVMRALWRTLGVPRREACCPATSTAPTERADTMSAATAADSELALFFRYCATCHHSNERTPPNFLHPDGAAPAQGVQHCAQRIYYRLAMWQQAPQTREKTPMPPHIALQSLHPRPDAWPRTGEFAAMQRYAARAIKDFDARTLLAQPYETLRSCLPPRKFQGAQQ